MNLNKKLHNTIYYTIINPGRAINPEIMCSLRWSMKQYYNTNRIMISKTILMLTVILLDNRNSLLCNL